jgi:hypothetical protein
MSASILFYTGVEIDAITCQAKRLMLYRYYYEGDFCSASTRVLVLVDHGTVSKF